MSGSDYNYKAPPGVTEKACTKCGETKQLEEFRKHPHAKYGRNPRCRQCSREEQRAKRAEDRSGERQRGRERYQANPEHFRRLRAESNRRNPGKHNVRHTLHRALESGEITKPTACQDCGAEPGSRLIHGHHEDYNKPLEVMWLCSTCHAKQHRIEADSDPTRSQLEEER